MLLMTKMASGLKIRDAVERVVESSVFLSALNYLKGQRARANLLVALAHRPELLVLDEPSSGLDPIVRRDILEAIIRAIADEGRTVLFSSHLLHEVERVSDYVTMMHQGKIVFSAPLDDIKQTHRCLALPRRGSPSAGARRAFRPCAGSRPGPSSGRR